MASIRVERVREKIKFEVARILQSEMNDPRMGFVTVVDCELTSDYRYAKVHVSVLSEREGEVSRVMQMLESARGYIQGKVAGRLHTRVTPELRFVLDRGAEQSVKISSLLDEIRREREEREAAQAGHDEEADGAEVADAADAASGADEAPESDGADDVAGPTP